jgi:hypothetical protein
VITFSSVAVGEPEQVACLARPDPGDRVRARHDQLTAPRGGGRLGHGDHVVPGPAGRVVHGQRGQRLHR